MCVCIVCPSCPVCYSKNSPLLLKPCLSPFASKSCCFVCSEVVACTRDGHIQISGSQISSVDIPLNTMKWSCFSLGLFPVSLLTPAAAEPSEVSAFVPRILPLAALSFYQQYLFCLSRGRTFVFVGRPQAFTLILSTHCVCPTLPIVLVLCKTFMFVRCLSFPLSGSLLELLMLFHLPSHTKVRWLQIEFSSNSLLPCQPADCIHFLLTQSFQGTAQPWRHCSLLPLWCSPDNSGEDSVQHPMHSRLHDLLYS